LQSDDDDDMTNNKTSACAGGEHTLFFDSQTKSLFSSGACGLGWCRNYPITATQFHLQKVLLHNDDDDDSKTGIKKNNSSSISMLPFYCRLFHASYYHNLAVNATNGQLYTWGCGTFVDQPSILKDDNDDEGKQKPNLDGVIPALGSRNRRRKGRVKNTTSYYSYSDLGEPPEPITLVSDDPQNIKDPIVDLSAGAYHSVILTQLGKLYTFGAGQLGQLGRDVASSSSSSLGMVMTDSSGLPVDPIPTPIQGFGGKVVGIGAGFYNTFAITTNDNDGSPSSSSSSLLRHRSLYCTGENQNKQCGEGPRNIHEMVRVKEITDSVDRVDGGYCHTLIQTITGKVFSMGCGEEGQRGDGRLDDDDVLEKRKILTPVILPKKEVKALDVAAGANHSVVLGDDGVAYTFGANDVGQCGVSTTTSQNTNNVETENEEEEGAPILSPTAVHIPNDAGRVVGISAGYAHTVLTTSKDRVFVFGQNDNGQLGIGKTCVTKNGKINDEPVLRPVEVKIPKLK